MSNADDLRDANPWHPITDPLDLKYLGKLCEEAGELASAVSRCIIQGIDECEPSTGKPNREWLEDEVADVQANIDLVVERFGLDEERMAARIEKKKVHLAAMARVCCLRRGRSEGMRPPSPFNEAKQFQDLKRAAEEFRVAMIESGAVNHVPQSDYIEQLRALERALNVDNYRRRA